MGRDVTRETQTVDERQYMTSRVFVVLRDFPVCFSEVVRVAQPPHTQELQGGEPGTAQNE